MKVQELINSDVQVQEGLDFMLPPGLVRKLSKAIYRRHFLVALKHLQQEIDKGTQDPLGLTARTFGLSSRVLQDYAKEAGMLS